MEETLVLCADLVVDCERVIGPSLEVVGCEEVAVFIVVAPLLNVTAEIESCCFELKESNV